MRDNTKAPIIDGHTWSHDCCWHPTGMARLSNPPQIEERCCWCGKIRYVSRWYTVGVHHGEFLPGAGSNAPVGDSRFGNRSFVEVPSSEEVQP